MKNKKVKLFPLFVVMAMLVNCFNMTPLTVSAQGGTTVTVNEAKGWFESAYVTWQPVSNAEYYEVYYKTSSSDDSAYKKIDDQLIRSYGSYYRADVVGLAKGSYVIKVAAVLKDGSTVSAAASNLTVSAYDRTGFAWVNGTASGAYNEDGTLKSDAVVLYITEGTKDSVTMDVKTSSSKSETAKGLQNILNAYKKGYETRPLAIRLIGNITDLSTMDSGDILIKGNGSSKRLSCGITMEGIGEDATANGWGLRIANSSNVEVRNIGFMNCNSGEGDNLGLQQSNDHVWVHNCDFFYGDAGSDADQAKGDGALDTKTSTYITHSYNHFFDTGKSNLQGMKSESTENYITYHHNWYDHSDSRHPRIRTCSVHVYNNYFDGVAKYGVGVTMEASAFVENNYFRNCPYPMLSSEQGSDIANGKEGTFSGEDGGIIKSYNNVIVGETAYTTYQENNTQFDAYEVTSADTQVPSSVKTYSGGTTYNNFDTNSSLMYDYTAEDPTNAVTTVQNYAGRMNGGDFKWEFNDAADDTSYAVNTELKSALKAYESSLVSVGGAADGSGSTQTTESTATTTQTTENTAATTTQTTENTAATTTQTTTEQPTTGNENQTTAGNQNFPSNPVVQENGFTSGGWFETLYAQWSDSNAKGAKVSYKLTSSSNYTEIESTELIRQKDNGIARVDIVGLTPGTYDIKVETAAGTVYTQNEIKVSAYDRSGYAHFNYTSGVGAYKDDGTLKDNAIVLYVTDENKDTIQIPGYESYATGIGNILNGQGNSEPLFSQLAADGKALDIRIVGTVNAPQGLTGYNSTENGGTKGDNGNMAIVKNAKNITLEGIGTDATIYGWGISFFVGSGHENNESYEVRNLTFTKAPEDELGFQGVMSGDELTNPIERVWVHHNSFYPGYCANPAESDKAEGDGSCDFKRGQYYTMAYNYYEGCHKTNLLGANDDNLQFHVTMHHNYYKDCASRMPLVRQADIHIYNNYFCGGTSKNVDARANAFVYSEANYYDSCKNPILTKSGAVVKSYNDVFYNCSEDNTADIVTDRTKTVSSSCTYANFDTNASVFYYDASKKVSNVTYLSDAQTAKTDCKAFSGVMKAVGTIDMDTENESVLEKNPTNNMVLPYSIQFTDKEADNYAGTKMTDAGIEKLAKTKDTVLDNMIIYPTSDYSTTSTQLKGKANIITFKVGEQAKITLGEMASKGDYAIVLYDAFGQAQLTVEDGEGSTTVPAGTYMIQTANAQKEGYIQSLKIEAAPAQDGGNDSENETNPDVNVTGITLNTQAETLLVGETVTLNATIEPSNATNKSVSWSSSNIGVAEVTNGVVTAKAAGTATITATADGGKTASCTITVEAPQEDTEVEADSVELNTKNAELTVGDTFELTATVSPENTADKTVTWTSSKTEVATVNGGKVTAVSEGTATITAKTVNGKIATCVVIVTKAVVNVESVTLNENSAVMDKGQTLTLTATVLPEDATDKTVTWTSSDDAVATVTADGSVKALGKGTATITATTVNGKTAKCEITVNSPVTGVILSETSKTIVEGGKINLIATVQPEEADNKDVTWNSDTPSVATVDNEGNVTAVAEGTATITVTTQEGNKTATCEVTVIANTIPVESIKVDKHSATLNVGQDETFSATILPEDASDQNVNWSSSNPSVATVDSKGTVTALSAGTATITVSSASNTGISAKINITVEENKVPVTNVSITDKSIKDIAAGSQLMLKYSIEPTDATVKDVLWSSSDETVAMVDRTGNIVAIKEGSATISIRAKGVADGETVVDNMMITVYNPVTEINVSNSNSEMVIGSTQQLNAKAIPTDATYTALNYESSDNNVITVSATGKVTAVAAGTATITITSAKGEAEKVLTITVKQPQISNPSYSKVFGNVKFDPESDWSEVIKEDGKKAEHQVSNVTTTTIPKKGFAITAIIAIPGTAENRPDFNGQIKIKVAARLGVNWEYVSTKNIPAISSGDLNWSEEDQCYYAKIKAVFNDDIEKYIDGEKQEVNTFEDAFTDTINGISFECAGYQCDYEGDIYLTNVQLENVEVENPELVDAETPVLKLHPEDAQYVQGDKANALTVKAEVTDNGELSYQWYENTKKGTEGATAITGADEAAYTPATNKEGTTYYYCVITNTNENATGKKSAEVTSDIATVVVKSKSTEQTDEPTKKPDEQEPTTQQPETSQPTLSVGVSAKAKDGSANYKVTVMENGVVEVSYVSPVDGNSTNVTVPATVTLEDGTTAKVTSIEANAFKNNKKLKKVTIGSNIKVIGKNAFSGCKNLQTVKGGKNVVTIDANAFANCKKLKSITIGSKVTSIGNKAFYKCEKLTKITIPAKVKKIGKQAFYGCKNLKKITIKTTKLTKKNVGSKAFGKINSKATIKVPKKKLAAYKTLLKSKGVGKSIKITK